MIWEICGSKLADIGRSGARVQERIVAENVADFSAAMIGDSR